MDVRALVATTALGLLLGDRFDRVAFLSLTGDAEPGVGLQHELVEMHPTLGLDRNVGESEVHQHRLAAPDPAPEINTDGAIFLRSEKSREEAAVVEARGQPVERSDSVRLRLVRLQFVGGNQLLVRSAYGSGHLAEGPFGRVTFFSVPLKL